MKVVIAGIAALACLFLSTTEGSGRLFENNCGTIKDSSMGPKIENGRNANELSNPWMVAVFVGNVSMCGGTLISSRFVLTASHCIDMNYMKVRLGEYNKKNLECECVGSICTPRAIDIDVDKKIMHRDYEGNINDIGLLRMKNEVTFTDKIRPICLLDKYPEEPIAHLKITGWGENGIGETQPILQEATVEIYERKWCKRKLSMDPLDVSRICAGDTGEFSSDSCKGDSGGPLFAYVNEIGRTVQLGIISKGINSCSGLGSYTNVTHFMDWILGAVEYYKV
ncbi:serine protease grass-like [Drosophila gunungcola]|uniref:serine protease grass-like n=1 Tax=Drosophila gunungcola TaxID=103775 RepID=UPI0022DE9B8F|nr:serine protease grass-like [Drosophila gunungcola]